MILRVMAHLACVLFHGDCIFKCFIVYNVLCHKIDEFAAAILSNIKHLRQLTL